MQANKKTLFYTFTVLGVSLITLALLAFFAGFRIFTVATPSMGTTAPVGSLVISKPSEEYNKNDIITFLQNGKFYTHRIVNIDNDTTFTTKGDLNGSADALPIKKDQVVGKVVFVNKYLGWVWKALPWIIIGFTVVYLLSFVKIREDWRWTFRLVGGSIVIMIITAFMKPWFNFEPLVVLPHHQNGVNVKIVNTGIFTFKAEGTKLASGESDIIHVTKLDKDGRYILAPQAAIGFWGVIFLLLYCLSPLILSFFLPAPIRDYKKVIKEIKAGKKIKVKISDKDILIAVLIVFAVLVVLLTQLSTFAIFTSEIKNTNNKLSTWNNLLCRHAMKGGTIDGINIPRAYFSYSMNNSLDINNVADDSGNNRLASWHKNQTLATGGACNGENNINTSVFDGDQCLVNKETFDKPNNFTMSVWFRTDRNLVKIAGFTDKNTPPLGQGNNDRNIYIEQTGRVAFGLFPGSLRVIYSKPNVRYDDNQWHLVTATLSSTEGAKLYLDGELALSDPNMRNGQNINNGQWRIGCGRSINWSNADGTWNDLASFTGQLQYFNYYDSVLNPAQVRAIYTLKNKRN